MGRQKINFQIPWRPGNFLGKNAKDFIMKNAIIPIEFRYTKKVPNESLKSVYQFLKADANWVQ